MCGSTSFMNMHLPSLAQNYYTNGYHDVYNIKEPEGFLTKNPMLGFQKPDTFKLLTKKAFILRF